MTENHYRTLIIGLGNPILSDDGIGWRVAERVEELISRQDGLPAPVEVDCLSVGGLSLMERLIGYDEAIIIDALNTGKNPRGTVTCFPLEDLPNRAVGHLSSAHDTTLQNALQVGLSMGAHLPDKITIVAVESDYVYDFSESLTPPVAAALPQAVQQVMRLLDRRRIQ